MKGVTFAAVPLALGFVLGIGESVTTRSRYSSPNVPSGQAEHVRVLLEDVKVRYNQSPPYSIVGSSVSSGCAMSEHLHQNNKRPMQRASQVTGLCFVTNTTSFPTICVVVGGGASIATADSTLQQLSVLYSRTVVNRSSENNRCEV